MFGFFKERRRARVRSAPFPAEWVEIIERNVPYSARLDEADRRELQEHVEVFLDEKKFEGCGGLELTDEIRVTIAAQACLLLLHRETDYYRRLVTILVYPSAYVARGLEPIGGGFVLEGMQGRLGEAWIDGVVVLSWDDVLRGARDVRDGHNVVLHEFAHQLDQEDGQADGAPILERRGLYAAWARVLGTEYEQLRRDESRHRKTVLDKYGATNPAEFFAVATECFFEKPVQLLKKHPELYEELREYYHQDPAEHARPSSLTDRAPSVAKPTVAVVGASTNRAKYGNKAVRAFLKAGYEVYPINPRAREVEGLKAYASLDVLPLEQLDRVSLYVPPAIGLGVVEQAAKKRVGEVWLNPGADAPEVVARAEDLGLNVVRACSILAVGEHPSDL